MPNPDLVTESNTFRAGNDTRDTSAASALSRELWGAMGAVGKGLGSNDSTLAMGAKLVGGAASDAASQNRGDREIDGNKKPMTQPPFTIEQRENGNRLNNGHKHHREDMCIDLTINIDLGSSKSHQGFNPGDKLPHGDIRPTYQPSWPRPTGHERVPSNSKIDQGYGQYLEKLEDKAK